MTEALIKFNFANKVNCYSAGIEKDKDLDTNTLKAIKEFGITTDDLYSKTIKELDHIKFDLIVTVCEDENIPKSLANIKTVHIEFGDPQGKKFFEYLKTMNNINTTLIPQLKELLK